MKSSGSIMALAVALVALSPSLAGAATKAEIARGDYLVNGPVACGNCHTPRDAKMQPIEDKAFAGGFPFSDPGFQSFSANITPDKETGLGNWTDAEIIHAIREGANKDGRIIFPPMPVPTYNNMSDDDVKAIVAYLRTLKPIKNEIPMAKYSIPQATMPPAKGLPAPPKTDKVAYGGYIVNALSHCFECHTSPGANGAPDFKNGLGAGGFEIVLGPGVNVRTANITSDPETGLGKWTDAEIKTAIVDGIGPKGGHLAPPMPYSNFKKMTNEDLDAVVAYLRTVPPIKNKVERTDFQMKAFP
ncbi:c-type cytochrome [Kaistia algarum]|uniref:c-type cytochrome n=1 Tax=Kaistia algarum TaxID=2083279 RepID=UPI001403DE2C|nr:c-type cytochrome [Kaistia algarum]MCX5512411.1 c-type cytochrome [Kaistia algarum]